MGEDGAVRTVVILGSTGSIGTQALDVIARNRADYEVVGLAAGGSNAALLAEQAAAFDVEVVAIADPEQADVFRTAFAALAPAQSIPQVLLGADGMDEMAALTCDVVLNAITGSIGLRPTLSALSAGRTVALANKESLIVGGPLVKALAGPDQLVPVDSEHSALAQCLRAGRTSEVRRLIITASGGPFLGRTRDQLAAVTAEQALQHPTWSMGPVVTINSATLMNKGLEVIEAHLLFDIAMEAIEVVVHPQSVV
ncbi:MAG TPA: 1-deoxy-D-xylulose-5-phosphate reductoisomerase, partial [Actinobacteria bacterium]|nr:1-deoxy-D-xylulose-5-phosphate reductoisomerase [Actinomycetota bacterium]